MAITPTRLKDAVNQLKLIASNNSWSTLFAKLNDVETEINTDPDVYNIPVTVDATTLSYVTFTVEEA